MKQRSVLLITILTCSYIMSCTKSNTTNDPTPSQNDSVLVSKIIDLDTSKPAGQDTIKQKLFSYDALKRVSSITEFTYTNGVKQYRDNSVFSYSGADSIYSTKTTYRFNLISGLEVDTIRQFCFFNASGDLILDSTVSGRFYVIPGGAGSSRIVLKNRYTGNFTQQKYYRYAPDQVSIDSSLSIKYYSSKLNKNIVNQIDTGFTGISNMGSTLVIATYDSKPNPLYPINRRQMLIGDIESYQSNNLSDCTVQYLDLSGTVTSTTHTTYVYEYNSLGLPVVCKRSILPNTSSYIKRSFYYTNK